MALALALTGLAWGCVDGGGGGDPSTDSGSHWLEPCEDDAVCGDLACVCGVCTASCDAAGACEGLAEAVVCVAPGALAGADCAGESAPPAGLCAAECIVAEDCREESVEFDCVGGYCVADMPPPTFCAPAQCGPEPGLPNVVCADGTVAGPTGGCLRLADGTCGWEITACDPPLCDDAECGPAPGIPNALCEDGVTMSGPTGRCLASATGCGWEIVDCPPGGGVEPPADCTADACGPAMGMPNWLCDDGTLGGPVCQLSADGNCGWTLVECPDSGEPVTCEAADCGPAPEMPNRLCDDGETVAGPACQPDETGTCAWIIVDCPDPVTPPSCDEADCGPAPGMPNYQCPDGTVGGPACQANENGTCQWIIVSCPG